MAPSEIDDEGNPVLPKRKPKKKKKKPKTTTIEFLEPTKREKSMAGAYGGAARGQLRRPGIKYDRERLKDAKKFRVSTADEPQVRAELQKLANSVSGFNQTGNSNQPMPKKQGYMGQTDGFASRDGASQRSGPVNDRSRDADSSAKIQGVKAKGKKPKKGMKDGDFEQMFGKDIDEFLEDSQWDIESFDDDKVSHYSRASGRSGAQKLRAIEKTYLQRQEVPDNVRGSSRGDLKKRPGSKKPVDRSIDNSMMKRKPKRIKPEPGPPRELIISYTDDPGIIHRGEILPFHTKKKNEKGANRGPNA